ncbi:hypothetical protein C8J55DRAFT_438415 [Lentinula edodes]|uniref:EF-hand domain-containing protein n=1 Tax=Lentinula lateritia TaxID=40482 RepID=A0A9W9DFD8_9AGAR|nr:hypothetical protein C8J55DRAFT_438415 [Lentinula edodes]
MSFYNENQPALAAAAATLVNLNGELKDIEATMSTFIEYCPIVVRGLESLSQLHPFIGIATKAFSLVITMDLTRRNNNWKVIALKMQIQDTMMILFELRHVKDPDQEDPDGNTMENRMGTLVKKIAEDITEVGSACDHYIKKSFVAKTLKSSKYEARLAAYGDIFAEHHKKLKLALSIHTVLGVDSANTKLDTLSLQMEHVQVAMAALLQKLDTSRENDLKDFIDMHGGPKACLQDDQLVQMLINISGEGISAITSISTGDNAKNLEAARKKLSEDYHEDLDKAFQMNRKLFERKMHMQEKQMQTFIKDSFHSEGLIIVSALKAGAHDRIIDADMQALWKENAGDWKGSVEARHFVLALQDFYIENLTGLSRVASPITPTSIASSNWPVVALPKDDRWALKYINISKVQPILEAIDDDGTGFISIKEVNTFALSKPKGWSLPVWIAYWATGWHVVIAQYKDKIHAVIHEMFKVIDYNTRTVLPNNKRNLPANRSKIDQYLKFGMFYRIDLLLRSLRPLGNNNINDVRLEQIIDTYSSSEEKRLEENLERVAYDIDTPATVALVTGPGRIERFILPLIYLLLRRHLKAFYLARTHILDEREFWDYTMSLCNVFAMLDDRISGLAAIFQQTVPDVLKRLGNFAFGLLQLSYDDDCIQDRSKSSLRPWNEEEQRTAANFEGDSGETIVQIPLDILKYGVRDEMESQIYQHSMATFHPQDYIPNHSLSGYWAGHILAHDSKGFYSVQGLIQIFIMDIDSDRKITGVAEAYRGLMNVSGSISLDNKLTLILTFENWEAAFTCEGQYDPKLETLSGKASSTDEETENNRASGETNTFFFTRTPAFAWRFHSVLDQRSNSARERWLFAIGAVLDQVQRTQYSWNYLKSRNIERRRFLALVLRREVAQSLSPANPLKKDERLEFRLLIAKLHPTDARFYYSLIPSLANVEFITHLGIECDGCHRGIIERRFICLTCIEPNFSNTLDLCSGCRDKAVRRDSFSHTLNHAMLKVDSVIHDGELAWAIPKAQSIAARIRELLWSKYNQTLPEGSSSKVEKIKRAEMHCCCCSKEVHAPCWICLHCPRDTYICDTCETAMNPVDPKGPGKLHKHKHHLIRIPKTIKPADLPTVDARLLTLEEKLAAVEVRLETFENRFSKLENMLQQVLDNRGS